MSPKTTPVAEIVRAIQAGEMVIVIDDDDRENEGDLIMAASKATPEQIAFMIRHTSGILCVAMPGEEAQRLRLDPMVAMNDAPMSTAFTVSVDYRFGLTTGISAEERCNTIRALANSNAGPTDFARPGHIFPLIARDGGVLIRSGHTEAGVDLARLAGLPPMGVLAELVNDDGSVKRAQQLWDFAREHGFKVVSVGDLIAYRQQRETLVSRVGESRAETPIGPARVVAYATPFDAVQHYALVFGEIGDGEDLLTRLHIENVLDDVFGKRQALTEVAGRFEKAGRGVLVYLREGSTGVKPHATEDPEAMSPTQRRRLQEWREVGVGAQILHDLGVRSIRLLASRPRRYIGLDGFGVAINETEILEPSG